MKYFAAIALAFGLGSAGAAQAQETINVAVGSGGNLESWIVEIGKQGGIFGKHGLNPDIRYTRGGGETIQAVVSGGVEIGATIGGIGVLSAFKKGAPIRVIGSSIVGSANYWYVRADSSIKGIDDVDGKKIGYSTVGSGTYNMGVILMSQYGKKFEHVATGATPATFTQVMTGQVDVGFAYPEFGQDALAKGETRIVFYDNDVDRIKNQSLRWLVANDSVSDEVVTNFMTAYTETIDWIYSGDKKPVEIYASLLEQPVDAAQNLIDKFWHRELFRVNEIVGLDIVMEDAVAAKAIDAPLSQEEIDKLIRLPLGG
ncbi:MAG TPA: ABC transporter substrate-binding protein [Rhizobiaceae bacterium]|nr:ABC transporter substrate-binding protein [Rhizobiaceae bacterium]